MFIDTNMQALHIFPIDIWFKIASHDFELCISLSKTFKEFHQYVRKNKDLMWRIFGTISFDIDTIYWKLGNRLYRPNLPTTMKLEGDVEWHISRSLPTRKPCLIACGGMHFSLSNKLTNMYFNGGYSYNTNNVIKKYFINDSTYNYESTTYVYEWGTMEIINGGTEWSWFDRPEPFWMRRESKALFIHADGTMSCLNYFYPNGTLHRLEDEFEI